VPFAELIPDASKEALSLLEGLLVYDPTARLSASDALLHTYFFTEPLPAEAEDLVLPRRSSNDSSKRLPADDLEFLEPFPET